MTKQPPLIFHVMHRLAVGGLENGTVNLINHIPSDAYRHAVVAIADITPFSKRIKKPNVGLYELNKKPGKDIVVYRNFYQLVKQHSPAIVHTRGLGAIDMQIPAALARVTGRVHSEHGWDATDPHGENKKNQRIRRILSPFIHHQIGLSKELVEYQIQKVGVKPHKISRIYNGVDHTLFKADEITHSLPFKKELVFGTVGRMSEVKNQVTLTEAFIQLCQNNPQASLGLVIVGDGELKPLCEKLLNEANLQNSVWLAGNRSDVPNILKQIQVFVLPSISEGISNTILEAMASSLPVIATDVGGNAELVEDNKTGFIVESRNADLMAKTMQRYLDHPELIQQQGEAGRKRIEDHFSLASMVQHYMAVYDQLLAK